MDWIAASCTGTSATVIGSVLFSGIIGFLVGVGYAVARRALRDWRDTRAAVPVMRGVFYGALATSVGRFMIAAVCLFGVFVWAFTRSP